jgi:hypothetical protein
MFSKFFIIILNFRCFLDQEEFLEEILGFLFQRDRISVTFFEQKSDLIRINLFKHIDLFEGLRCFRPGRGQQNEFTLLTKTP